MDKGAAVLDSAGKAGATFKMPAGDVTLTAHFVAVNKGGGGSGGSGTGGASGRSGGGTPNTGDSLGALALACAGLLMIVGATAVLFSRRQQAN